MLWLVLLLLPSLSLSTKEGIKDPSKCIDIPCYKPIKWSGNTEEVCRFKKEKRCIQKTEDVCMDVMETRCELVDYTKCKWDKSLVSVRDDKVVGEKFVEKECYNTTITVKEKKPKCINVTKPSCEEKWIPEPPFWVLDPSTCVDLNWTICNETYLHPVPIDYCNCTENEIWYNKLERVETQCVEEHNPCVPHVVPSCKTVPVPMCKPVTWIECKETCEPDCSPMHFRTPSQEPDHRRWCSHVDIVVPPGVNVSPNGHRELTNKQSTNEVTNSNGNIVSNSNDNVVSNSNDNVVTNSNNNVVSNANDNVVSNANDNVASNSNVASNDNVVSNPKSKKGNSFSHGKTETTYSNQRSNSQRTTNPDSLSSPIVYSRSGPSSNRRSSVPQILKGKWIIRQGQQIRG